MVDVSTGWGALVGLVAPLFVFVAGNGFIVANSIGGALSVFPERAGAVSALTGAMQYGSGILGSGLVGLLADGTPRPLAWISAWRAKNKIGSSVVSEVAHEAIHRRRVP